MENKYKKLKKDIKKLKACTSVSSIALFEYEWGNEEISIEGLVSNKIPSVINLGGDFGFIRLGGLCPIVYNGFHGEVISKSVMELCRIDSMTEERKIKIIKKYSLNKKHLGIWMSTKMELFIGSERVKRVSRLIREINPDLSDWAVIEIVDKLQVDKIIPPAMKSLNFRKSNNISAIYKTAKISSCMADKDMSLIKELGGSVVYIEYRGNILSRTIVYDHNMTMSKTYSTSTLLTLSIEKYLYEIGYRSPNKNDSTLRVKLNGRKIQSLVYPYMDIYQNIFVEDGYIWLSENHEGRRAVADTTTGSYRC